MNPNDPFTLEEKLEMVFIYGEAQRNVSRAVELYAEKFQNVRVPSYSTIDRVIKHFKQFKTLETKKRSRSRRADDDHQIAVLAAVAVNPNVSCRQIEEDSGISKSSVQRILKANKLHPYHISLHQGLHGTDFENRVRFCNWATQQINQNENFFFNVLFSDESTFTNHGNVNRHNLHYWSSENPHWLRQVEHQRPWSVNVWCGIVGEHLVGPFFIDGHLNGEKYRNFLRNNLPELLDNVPLEIRRMMWYQHEGCPAHFSRLSSQVLDEMLPNKWIGRAGELASKIARSHLT